MLPDWSELRVMGTVAAPVIAVLLGVLFFSDNFIAFAGLLGVAVGGIAAMWIFGK